ncbi:MAG: hypothetical protein E7J69_06300 [Atlantibacter hermannii]|nr:hypothetical protein [Atlantibacter hermannii]
MNSSVKEMLQNPRFIAVLEKCLVEEELIAQFERIYEVSRPPSRIHPIERMVDEATGFRDEQWSKFFSAFIPFVYEIVWLRWKERDDESCWTSTPTTH